MALSGSKVGRVKFAGDLLLGLVRLEIAPDRPQSPLVVLIGYRFTLDGGHPVALGLCVGSDFGVNPTRIFVAS